MTDTLNYICWLLSGDMEVAIFAMYFCHNGSKATERIENRLHIAFLFIQTVFNPLL